MKIIIHILSIILLFNCINVSGQKKLEKKSIKLDFNDEDRLIHFKNNEYIISFAKIDILDVATKLKFSFDTSLVDTLILKKFIHEIDSIGKGNLTNNFRLNKEFRALLDNGKIKIFSISKNIRIKKIKKVIDDRVSASAGTLFYYKENNLVIIEFAEAFIGCPSF